MSETLNYQELADVFRAASTHVKSGAERLCELDSATGDGDHGVAMTRAMDALEKGIDDCAAATPKALLQSVAMSVMSIDAGSTGPLLGSLMMGLGEPLGEAADVDCQLLASMFDAGRAKLLAISKANVGDKTMVDALSPAVDALNTAADAGETIASALEKAAAAAEAGAESTKGFQAKFGRARNLGERTIGYQDPGATSMAMFFRGCADGAAAIDD